MNYANAPTHDARAVIARELAQYYAELAGTDAKPAPRFSLVRVVEQMTQPHGLQAGYEREVCASAALVAGTQHDGHRVVVPLAALAQRDLTAGAPAQGGFLVQADVPETVDILRPWSVVARAGVQVVSGLVGNVSIPRVTSASAAGWASTESSTYTESQPTIGTVTMVPHAAAVSVDLSRQWRLQAQDGEQMLRAQLMRAVGQLVDQAFLAGDGAAAPRGLVNTAGINTASGTSLALAGLLEMREEVIAAGADESRLQWVSTPAVQRVLAARERNSGGGRNLWDDNGILGRPAAATASAPTGALVVGDFSTAVLGIWGPAALRLEIDPYANFVAGVVSARVVLTCDFAFARPEAFSVASSVT